MNLLAEKMKEVSRTLLPVVLLVLLLCFTIVDVGQILYCASSSAVSCFCWAWLYFYGSRSLHNPIGSICPVKWPLHAHLQDRCPQLSSGFPDHRGRARSAGARLPDRDSLRGVLAPRLCLYRLDRGGVLISLGVFRLLRICPSISSC